MTAALALTGCGKSSDSSSTSSGSKDGKYKDEITIDVFDAMANYQGIQSGWFAKVVKDKFNMKLNIIAPNVAGGGDTLFQTRSTAGNLGDLVIIGTENGKLKDTVKAGLLADMTDLLKGKDVMKNYKTAITNTNKLTGQKGIYALPSEISNQSPNVSADGIEPLVANYVGWDAYKKAGYPTINTLDDMIPVLKKMQQNTPKSDSGKKTYAISLFKDWDGETMMAASNYASLYGYKNTGFVFSKADGSENQDAIDSNEIYVKSLKFLFKANQAGLIDPESTTQNYDMLSDKYRDGQILTSLWSYQGSSLYNTTDNKKAGKGFMPANIKDSSPYTSGCYSEGNSKTIIAIGSKAKDPQRLADFIDWMYSPEGMECVGQANGAAGPSIYMKYLDALRDFYGAAFHQNVPVDLISVEDDLDPYQVVIAPLLCMTKGTYDEKIRAFVQNGGTFITSYFSGIVDEHDLVILGGYPGRLRDILGIWVEENDALPEGESNSFYYKGEKYPAEILCDLMHLEGANEISTYEEDFYQGTPVITKNAFDKGNAYYVGTRSNHEFYDIFLKDVFEEAGIKPVMKTPEGVEASVRRNQKGEVLFLLNHSGEEKKVLLEEDYLDLLGKDRLHKGDFVTLTKNDVKLLWKNIAEK